MSTKIMNETYIIVGTGISGLLAALLLADQTNSENIYLIERNKEIGGLLRCFDYGPNGLFDYGMHTFSETGIYELDRILRGLLPEEKWFQLQGKKRDLAGIFFNGILQHNSPYIDLRNLPGNQYEQALSELFLHLDKVASQPITDSTDSYASAADFAVQRFGKYLAEKTLIPVLEKIHKKSAYELDFMATIFTPLNRLLAFGEALSHHLTQAQFFRDRIAYSEQRNLPAERSSGRNSYYPLDYGVVNVINAIYDRLMAKNVKILTESELTEIHFSDSRIQTVQVRNQTQTFEFSQIKSLIWTSNIPALGRYLHCDFGGMKYDPPLKTLVVNLLVSKPLDLGDLYYFFCYDPGFNTYRLTNYSNYCPGAYRNGGYPVSLEMLVAETQNIDFEERAKDEIRRFGLLAPDTRFLFAKSEILEAGFPMPSINNIKTVKNIRQQIRDLDLNNLILTGILSEDNLFFQTDVLIDTYQKLTENGG